MTPEQQEFRSKYPESRRRLYTYRKPWKSKAWYVYMSDEDGLYWRLSPGFKVEEDAAREVIRLYEKYCRGRMSDGTVVTDEMRAAANAYDLEEEDGDAEG